MKGYLCIFLSLLCQLFCLVKADNFPEPRFKYYTVEEGLSVNTVTAIHQDSKGLMWIGTTNGLNRYDGMKFKLFYPEFNQESSSSNIIFNIKEDGEEKLWVGTAFGIYIFNPFKESFSYFSAETKEGEKINSTVFSILKDHANNMWIGTLGQGLFVYDYARKQLIKLSQENGYKFKSKKIRNLYEDSRGVVWALTYDDGIHSYNPVTGQSMKYVGYDLFERSRYDVMFEDSFGNLWLGSYNNGLSKLDYRTGEFTHYLTPNTNDHILHIRSILEYSPGMLLLASDDGLTFFNTFDKQTRNIRTNPISWDGINDDYLYCTYKDKEGGIWIGTYFGGINYTSQLFNNFKQFSNNTGNPQLPARIVSVFCEDDKENLWIGTDDGGLIYYDTGKSTFRQYLPCKKSNSISYHNIHALHFDAEANKLWIGTYSDGLNCLDIKTGMFKHYPYLGNATTGVSTSVYSLLIDSKGTLWAGTPKGLFRYDKAADTFNLVPDTYLCDIRCLLEDENALLWCSSFNKGLIRYNLENDKIRHYFFDKTDKTSLPVNSIVTLCKDKNKTLWIGTDGGGICSYNSESENFIRYSGSDFPSRTVNKIIAHDEFLWISTNIGLIRWYPRNKSYKIYTQSDGLQSSQFIHNSGLKTSNGTLYFGGINGFNSFVPEKLKENTFIPNAVITNLHLFNKEVVCVRDSDILQESILYTDEINLSYDKSVLGIDVASLSYIAPEKNLFSYQLEGFDKEWSSLEGEKKVTYTNLQPGSYIFRVKVSNNDELWNSTGTSLKIKIHPPFWRSDFAYFLYAIISFGLILFSILFSRHRITVRHKEQLERLRVSKEKELYEDKISFFTQIIHEIRTPLTLIKGPLATVLQTNKRVNDVKEDLLTIERNSNRLLELVNQLMDFRKIEAKNIDYSLKIMDINPLLLQLYENFRQNAIHKNIELKVVLPEEPALLSIDMEAFNKIISNLLSNALKFSKNLIEIKAEKDVSGQNLIIYIADNGPGVPEHEQEKIFEAFYQSKQNLSCDYIGTGLGLSLTRSLVTMMKGKIVMRENPGGGACFVLSFPVAVSDEKEVFYDRDRFIHNNPLEELNESTKGKSPESEEAIASGIPQLIIVDDNDDIRSFIARELNACYELNCFSNAPEALQFIQEEGADMIISDVMMPEMDGFTFCHEIKKAIRTSHIPVILLTAKVDVDAKIEGLDNGADAYLEKPFAVEHLKAQINSLLKNRELLKKHFVSTPTTSSLTLATTKADALLLEKIDEFIEEHMMNADFSIEDMARSLGMSRSSFFAKIRSIAGITPNDYIRLARLKKAVKLFEKGETRINEVCFQIGFNSPSYFAKCFQQQFGELPTVYIKKIREGAVVTL